MGRLVYELQKEPGVRRDMNQFTCLNSKKTERGMPGHAVSIWTSVHARVRRRHDYYTIRLYDAQGLMAMRLFMSCSLQMSVLLCSRTPLL